MKEIVKGLILFVLSWTFVIVFYYLPIMIYIGELLQKLLNTPTMPAFSILVDICLIVLISYFLNKKFIYAKKLTFIISESIFGISVIILYLTMLQAIADGILMNA